MKKQTGTIKRRLIAIALTVITLSSFTTVTITSASAATNQTTVSASLHRNADKALNDSQEKSKEEEKKKEEEAKKREKTVTALVNSAISAAKGDFVKAISTSLELLPYGKCLSALFEYGYGLISDVINEQDPSAAVEAPKIEDIKVQLDKVREQLNVIEGLVKELKNEDFNKSINTLIRMYDKHNAKITKLANARYELAKAKKAKASETEIEKKQQAADKALKAIKDIDSKDIQDLRKGIEKCTQYMAGKTQGGMKDNPFRINLDSVMTAAGSGSFGNYIYNETVEKYDKAIWTYYTTALTLYTSLERIKINELVKTDEDTAKEEADELQLLLNGKLNGETKTERQINAADAYKYYKENVVNEEIKYKDQYKYQSEWKKYFTSIGTGKADSSGFTATGNYINRAMADYIDNISSSGKLTVENKAFATNFKYINDMIAKYRELCDPESAKSESTKSESSKAETPEPQKDLKLRDFLEKNLCTKLPAESKYLVVGQMKATYSAFGHLYTLEIPVIKLDEGNAKVENITICRSDDRTTYVSNTLDNVCYFAENLQQLTQKVAVVTNYYGKETVFGNFADAWTYANQNGSCKIKLYADVTAKNVEGSNATAFGEGEFFTRGSNKGALYVRNYITLDLNGHTINRNQKSAVDDGSVFIKDKDSSELEVIDSSGKKGVITGGNTTGNGGAFYDTNTSTFTSYLSRVTFENVVIKDNHANGLGGGIYFSESSDGNRLILNNCEITNNTAGKNGGGIYCASGNVYTADVTVKGNVQITGNTVNGSANNATLTDTAFGKTVFNIDDSFSSGSRIGVNSTTSDHSLRITSRTEHMSDCRSVFSADFSSKKINVCKGFMSSSYYAEICDA